LKSTIKINNLLRILGKTLALLIVVNFFFIVVVKIPFGRISLYGTIFKPRERLPFGENPEQSYNLTMSDLESMIASHEVSAIKNPGDKFKIILLGDSSIWGFLQKNEDTLAGILSRGINFQCREKEIEILNLGYPSLSVVKDLMILESVNQFDPDLILWFVTLESLPKNKQKETPLVNANPHIANRVFEKYEIELEQYDINPLDYTFINQRRVIADWFRLQIFGFMWSATGIDHFIPESFSPAQRDFENDKSFMGFDENEFEEKDLALDVLFNPTVMDGETDFIYINEPILISQGIHSDIRYNFYYPRWAYDFYRSEIKLNTDKLGIKYYDFWDIVPESEFTNSAIHLTQYGETLLAEEVIAIIKDFCSNEIERTYHTDA